MLGKGAGRVHGVRFTPDDSDAFKRALDEALTRFRQHAQPKAE